MKINPIVLGNEFFVILSILETTNMPLHFYSIYPPVIVHPIFLHSGTSDNNKFDFIGFGLKLRLAMT